MVLANVFFCFVSIVTLLRYVNGGLGSQQKGYIIQSDTLPDDERFRPQVGNGHIASNVYSDTVYMNGFYNGRGDRSSRARIPAFVNVDINSTDTVILREKYTLDMYNGIFIKTVETQMLNVTVTTFAHRRLYQLLVTQVSFRRNAGINGNITVYYSENFGKDSNDIVWLRQQFRESETLNRKSIYRSGKIRETEVPGGVPTVLHVYHTVIPTEIEIPSGKDSMSVTYIASHSNDREDALVAFKLAIRHSNDLLTSHKQAWNALWDEGRIDIYGNDGLSSDVAAAAYNILCSLPTVSNSVTPFFGLGPGGLSRGGLLYPDKPGGPHNDYAGHIFWDMDTWIMPPIMMFHPSMARHMIESRIRVLDQSKRNAEMNGYRGAKFPWEQASTGIETTPKWAGNMSMYEIHVTADVSYALRQYLYATDDVTILRNGRGFEMAVEIARFWQSRVSQTEPDTVEILGVMGPDEYHFNVNNSVFTNYNAKLSLTLPRFIIDQYNLPLNKEIEEELITFERTAEDIVILFDSKSKFHPQYENFNVSAPIKQSDVVLLGYPLMMPMTKHVRRNDLEFYEKITDIQGPDTGTWSMHTVGWLELGNEESAHRNFRMMFRNINEPFKVFSEKPVTNQSYGGCVNFITGAGGLLQSIVFGYGGLRLYPDRLQINPMPILNTTSWRLKGIHYRAVVIDIEIDQESIAVTLVKKSNNVTMTIDSVQIKQSVLHLNTSFTFKRQPANLRIHSTNGNKDNITPLPPAAGGPSTQVSVASSECHVSVYSKVTAVACLLLLFYLNVNHFDRLLPEKI